MSKIALVVGHDVNNRGAYGNKGISEWAFYNQLTMELELPDKHDYMIMHRNPNLSGYTEKMEDIHERIDDWGADISVEFHFNSFSNKNVNGHEVLYCSKKSKEIAKQLDKAFDDNLENSDRGIKKVTLYKKHPDRGAGFCCRGESLAIILEPFFGAHQHEFIQDGSKRELLKKAISEFLENIV